MMHISTNGVSFLKSWEKLALVAYKAVPTEKLWTIGYGHYGVAEHTICTAVEAEQILIEDLQNTQDILNHYVKVPLTQNQYDALVSLVFNIGSGNFLSSNAFKYLNAGNYEHFTYNAFDPIHGFVKSGGVIVKGLVNRRNAEKNIFTS